ncbi:LLM class flavin-dependent oxidoreductase [Peterkaempfera bronchialis]|uniref:LLM class flavin-dependent oxidoreductase n=1 Tax=Peterkaempfera bronchialis TaxID=2126346 RepID=A0A345SY84_9ACTN|nr:LLM class flavin-dependent oxidoreductase [Peterkaempfera bronchialis]AXI78689.1 LLM class flavin-dependent oxidoreductase [Peterkaempfera bronchialis]
MRLSTVILPIHRWNQGGREVWRRAEELGFHAAYTYDHLSWRTFRDEPWFGAVPTLTAAAAVTERIRLGTMVTSPNFRHPVTLAKDLMSVDDISGGRLTVGIGAGGTGFDATALGQEAWTARERADRFGEFVSLLDRLLRDEVTTAEGRFYSAHEARMVPGCVQRPRLPLHVAATGPRGLRLAAEYGQGWISYGDPRGPGDLPAEECPGVIAGQLARLADACAAVGRDPGGLEKVLLQGSTRERPLDSLDAFVDYAGRYRELGITEIVIHWPVPGSIFEADPAVFERIATEGLAQLG